MLRRFSTLLIKSKLPKKIQSSISNPVRGLFSFFDEEGPIDSLSRCVQEQESKVTLALQKFKKLAKENNKLTNKPTISVKEADLFVEENQLNYKMPRDYSQEERLRYKYQLDRATLNNVLAKNSFLKSANNRLKAIQSLKDDPEYELVEKKREHKKAR